MSHLVQSSSYLPGAHGVRRFGGLGPRGDQIPSTGDYGPPPLYHRITLPADAAAELQIEVLTWPSAGVLFVNDDSSFTFSGAPDGVYSWTYRAKKDGVVIGTFSVELDVGPVAAADLSGTAAATSFSGGDLSTAIRLAAVALDQASGGGGLTTQIDLDGSALDQALATGTLTTQIHLAGAALDQVGASASLTVGIGGIGGDALDQVLAGGDLSTGIVLTAAALDVTTATGALASLPIVLDGAAVSLSAAGGVLTAQIRLAGSALDQVAAYGALDGGHAGTPGLFTIYSTVVRATTIRTRVLRPTDPARSYPVTQTVTNWQVGQVARISGRITDSAGMVADPGTVRLLVKAPGGAVTTYDYGGPAVVRDGPGLYRADVVVDAVGVWAWRWEADPPNKGMGDGEIFVAGSKL